MTETIIPQTPTSFEVRRPSAADRAAAGLVAGLASHLSHGTLVLRDGNGARRYGSNRPDEPVADVTITDPRAYTATLRGGSVGFGRSYVQGWWDCDDLTALVRVLIRNLEGLGRIADRRAQVVRWPPALTRLPRRDKDSDRRDVQAHYDLGNDFFELMLDPTMMYSCGLFERPDVTLEEASTAKLDRICRFLDLGPDDHVIEIGTGWGGFAVHAASVYGCRVTTTTISDAQYQYAAKRVAEAGLGDLITVRNDDYRDITGRFDKLVSIEMIEAIGWREFDTFFSTCSGLVGDDGLVALQAIVIADQSYDRARYHDDFIKRMIFPGGCLPSIEAMTRSGVRADLRVIQLDDIGAHYVETLRRWRANFDGHIEEVAAMGLDDGFQRLWRLYLCYCEAAFLERHVSDVQMVLAKPGWRPGAHGFRVAGRSRSTVSTT